MRKTALFSLITLSAILFSACSVHKGLISNHEARRNNAIVQRDNREEIRNYTPYTSLTYIDRFKTIAIQFAAYKLNQDRWVFNFF